MSQAFQNFLLATAQNDTPKANALAQTIKSLPHDTLESFWDQYHLANWYVFQGEPKKALDILNTLRNSPLDDALWAYLSYVILISKIDSQKAETELSDLVSKAQKNDLILAAVLDFQSLLFPQNANTEKRLQVLERLATHSQQLPQKAHFQLRLACALQDKKDESSNSRALQLLKYVLRPQSHASTEDRLFATETLKRLKKAA